jgi:ferritin-like protein
MIKVGTHHVLNRLLTVLHRSLPMYLTYASPWTQRGDEQALATLRHIVEDQKQLANRVAQYILQNHGPIEIGEYPIEFLDTHDLSLDFLLTKLVEYQKKDIAALERCVAQLQSDRQAAALAEEALGAARGHLESLQDLADRLAKSSSTG